MICLLQLDDDTEDSDASETEADLDEVCDDYLPDSQEDKDNMYMYWGGGGGGGGLWHAVVLHGLDSCIVL